MKSCGDKGLDRILEFLCGLAVLAGIALLVCAGMLLRQCIKDAPTQTLAILVGTPVGTLLIWFIGYIASNVRDFRQCKCGNYYMNLFKGYFHKRRCLIYLVKN